MALVLDPLFVGGGVVLLFLSLYLLLRRIVRREIKEFRRELQREISDSFRLSLLEAKGDLKAHGEGIEAEVRSLQSRLSELDAHLREIEKARAEAYGGLLGGIERLQSVTSQLREVLSHTRVRGRWGEMTLRRIVELCGMVEHTDFETQVTLEGPEGKTLRPDMVVHLPSGRSIVVDSKVPLDSYLEALQEADEGSRREKLRKHAEALRAHIRALSSKSYDRSAPGSPEFVVLFLPGESFLQSATEIDPSLFEEAFERRVVLSTPSTLYALLKVVALGWREERLQRSAYEIQRVGARLHDEVLGISESVKVLGKSLEKAVESYNVFISRLESRVLGSARKLRELGVPSLEEIPEMEGIERNPRPPP